MIRKQKLFFLSLTFFLVISFLTPIIFLFYPLYPLKTEGVPTDIPERSEDVQGFVILREDLLRNPRLLIFANRKSYEIIEKTAEDMDYPAFTIWLPNISQAPGWVIRLFIKPALKKTADKVSHPILYDPEGVWNEALQITSEDNYYLAVFYLDSRKVVKVLERVIPEGNDFGEKGNQQNLFDEIISLWSKELEAK